MRKMILPLFTLLLSILLVLPLTAGAETKLQTSGTASGGQTSAFWVISDGNASLKLTQTMGNARGFFSAMALAGADNEYGHYHIRVNSANSSTPYTWSSRKNGGSYTLSFSQAGTYLVEITPYTSDEMDKLVFDGEWIYWETTPSWKVEKTTRCQAVTSVEKFITVYCRETNNGPHLGTHTLVFRAGQEMKLEAPAVSGYQVISETPAELRLDSAGMPRSYEHTFYYKKDVSATIRVEGRCLSDNSLLYSSESVISEGFTTFTAREISGYTLVSNPECSVHLSSSGSLTQSGVTFYYTRNTPSRPGNSGNSGSNGNWGNSGNSGTSGLYRRSDFTIGSYVEYGHYEQDCRTSNGMEPISWIVLDRKGNQALLLSVYGLDAIPYHDTWYDEQITWEACTARTWLNGIFASTAFTQDEYNAICLSRVSTPWMSDYSTWPGPDTRDRVFLLSYQEVERYLSDWFCWPTPYAHSRGALYNGHNGGTTYWWLRSPNEEYKVSIINSSGHLWPSRIYDADGTVRPAMWVDLSQPVFY